MRTGNENVYFILYILGTLGGKNLALIANNSITQGFEVRVTSIFSCPRNMKAPIKINSRKWKKHYKESFERINWNSFLLKLK